MLSLEWRSYSFRIQRTVFAAKEDAYIKRHEIVIALPKQNARRPANSFRERSLESFSIVDILFGFVDLRYSEKKIPGDLLINGIHKVHSQMR